MIKLIKYDPKSKKYITDLCTKWLDCKSSCNNMLDLYSILIKLGNKELIDIFNKSVYYKTNGIKLDYKYLISKGITFFMQDCLDNNINILWLKNNLDIVEGTKDKTYYEY